MKIEIELDKTEAEMFVIAKTKDESVKKFSEENLELAVQQTIKLSIYEAIANFEFQQASEIKKAQMQEWFNNKAKEIKRS